MKNIQWVCLKLTVVLISIITSGCATYGTISALPMDYQELIHNGDRKTLTSEKYNLVGLSPRLEKIRNKGWGEFILTIENRSLNNMQFSVDDISARSYDMNTDETMELTIFKREELIRKEKSSQKYRKAWDTLGSVLYALDTIEKAGTSSYSSSQSAQKSHEDKLAKSKNKNEETLRNLELLMPENTMILSGEKMNGLIRVQLPKITDTDKRIMFSINLDEEEHKLAFVQEKINNAGKKSE